MTQVQRERLGGVMQDGRAQLVAFVAAAPFVCRRLTPRLIAAAGADELGFAPQGNDALIFSPSG